MIKMCTIKKALKSYFSYFNIKACSDERDASERRRADAVRADGAGHGPGRCRPMVLELLPSRQESSQENY